MWSEIKFNFKSGRVYLKEFFLTFLFLSIFAYLLINDSHRTILVILLLFLTMLVLLYFIGKNRRHEINDIKTIINNIRLNRYSDSHGIKLSNNLKDIEKDIKQMYDKIQEDISYLKRLERIRTEFLGNVSHELRTPIFAIQGYIETLLDGAINDSQVNMNFLEKANHHTINLNNLLNDLIDISMIESGEMRMSLRYFNVNEYMKPLLQDFKTMAQEKNIELNFIPAREGLELFGDKEKLRQVMSNLLTNAIKYTEEGKVEILVEEEKKYGRIIIRDTGIGISREDIPRIFERFFRVDKARSRAVGGTGLGLAIVKHIIEAHGSKMEVKSELNKGSEFSFKLKK